MKLKRSIVVMALAMLLVISFSGMSHAADINMAMSDPQGDVSDPNIDIVQVSVRTEDAETYTGSQVVFKVEVAGQIQYENSDYSYSFAISTGGETGGALITFSDRNASWGSTGSYSQLSFGGGLDYLEIFVPDAFFQDLGTITTIVVTAANNDGNQDVVILQAGSSDDGSDGGSDDSGDDDSSSGGAPPSPVPGFEAVLSLVAISMAVIEYAWRRRL